MLPIEEWRLNTHLIGRRVLLYDQVDSTNTAASSLAEDPANNGTVVMAREQTAGRGTNGRKWHCRAGEGVLLSVLVFPPQALRRPVILAALAANSICETIDSCTGLEARIKWPNDILIKGRKVAGILIEQAQAAVIGIGLNVNQEKASFGEQDLPAAGSLALATGRKWSPVEIARKLILELDLEYQRLHQGDVATLESSWKERTGILGKSVLLESLDGCLPGVISDLTFGGLYLKTEFEQELKFLPEKIRHIVQLSDESKEAGLKKFA